MKKVHIYLKNNTRLEISEADFLKKYNLANFKLIGKTYYEKQPYFEYKIDFEPNVFDASLKCINDEFKRLMLQSIENHKRENNVDGDNTLPFGRSNVLDKRIKAVAEVIQAFKKVQDLDYDTNAKCVMLIDKNLDYRGHCCGCHEDIKINGLTKLDYCPNCGRPITKVYKENYWLERE